jgi:MFS family permease
MQRSARIDLCYVAEMFLNLSPLVKHRDYRLLYTGQLVSAFGSMITYVAVPYQVFELTHSSFAVGMLGAAQLVPLLVFALLGGSYADAMDRRRLLIVSEVIMALGSLALAVNGLLPHSSIALIFVVGAVMSGTNGFHRPALDAITPRLVDREDLTAVSALNFFRFSISAIGGPAIGGVCMAALGYATTYFIDVLSFLVSLAALAAIRRMPPSDQSSRPGLASIAKGLKYAVSRPELIGTYVVDLVAMTFAMPIALFPAMSVQWGGAKAAGWLYSAMSFGSLFTTVFSGWTSKVNRHGVAVLIAAAIWALAIVFVGFSTTLPIAVLGLAVAGAADSVSGVFRGTIWNETIPGDLRGRLAGVEMISYLSGPLLGNARAGWVASISSITTSVVSGGLICFVAVLLCIPLLPVFWNYRAGQHVKAAVAVETR